MPEMVGHGGCVARHGDRRRKMIRNTMRTREGDMPRRNCEQHTHSSKDVFASEIAFV
jgi:hypothetical protein